jgi:hypothetical protein
MKQYFASQAYFGIMYRNTNDMSALLALHCTTAVVNKAVKTKKRSMPVLL